MNDWIHRPNYVVFDFGVFFFVFLLNLFFLLSMFSSLFLCLLVLIPGLHRFPVRPVLARESLGLTGHLAGLAGHLPNHPKDRMTSTITEFGENNKSPPGKLPLSATYLLTESTMASFKGLG